MVIIVRSAPQGRSDVELLEQTFNKINEAEYDYRYLFNMNHIHSNIIFIVYNEILKDTH